MARERAKVWHKIPGQKYVGNLLYYGCHSFSILKETFIYFLFQSSSIEKICENYLIHRHCQAGVTSEMTLKMFTPALSLPSAIISSGICTSANCSQLMKFHCQHLKAKFIWIRWKNVDTWGCHWKNDETNKILFVKV